MKLTYTQLIETTTTTETNEGDSYVIGTSAFEALLKHLEGMVMVASTCLHHYWNDFISWEQGGSNSSNLTKIVIVEEDTQFKRLAIRVYWASCHGSATVIMEERKEKDEDSGDPDYP